MSALQAFYAGAFSTSSTTNSLATFSYDLPSSDTYIRTVPVALTSGYYLFTFLASVSSATATVTNFNLTVSTIPSGECYYLPIVYLTSTASAVYPISFICRIPANAPNFELSFAGVTSDTLPLNFLISQFFYQKLS